MELRRAFVRLFSRSNASQVAEESSDVVTRPVPSDPAELGLLLRSVRERRGLSLEEVRERTDVPLVDLDALERGQLELLYTQHAAVIALWRYAELLELDPQELGTVLRTHWPNRGLAVDALATRRGFTPLGELKSASRLLMPITDPLVPVRSRLGLSEGTRQQLEGRSAKHLLVLQLLAPVGPIERLEIERHKATPALSVSSESQSPPMEVARSQGERAAADEQALEQFAAVNSDDTLTGEVEVIELAGERRSSFSQTGEEIVVEIDERVEVLDEIVSPDPTPSLGEDDDASSDKRRRVSELRRFVATQLGLEDPSAKQADEHAPADEPEKRREENLNS